MYSSIDWQLLEARYRKKKSMTKILNVLQLLVFAGLGVFLLLRGYYLTGGFCLLVAAAGARIYE